MNAAEVHQGGKRYGDKWALRCIDLTVPNGVVLGLVGPNGAGKSTLLHLLVGLTGPDEGAITVFGEKPGSAAVLPDVAFVAQDAPLPKRLRVRELVQVCGLMNPRWDESVVIQRVEELQLDPRARVATLSGGQRAQLALALALAKRPRLLVLDEPVASLDPLARRLFLGALMGAVADRDLTVVYSTHLLEDLERACDHLAVIARGEMRLTSRIDDVVHDHVVLAGSSGRDLPSGVVVLSSTVVGRHAQHLVRLDVAVHDPAWTVRPATLEEVVFAHLAERQAPATPRLDLVS